MRKNCTKLIVLLFVLLYSISSIAQIRKATGKVIRIEGKSYISQQGRFFEIDEKNVLAKLKSEKNYRKQK